MDSSNLLKEAIADAKAVRQTALANAKVALEEAFSEKYQAMFAEKLKEDAAMGEANPAPEGGANPAEENVSEQEIDELIKELEAEVADNPQKPEGDEAPMAATPVTPATVPPVPGAASVVPPAAVPPVGTPCTCPQCGAAVPVPGAVPAMPPVGGEVPPTVPPVGGEIPPTGKEPGAMPPSETPPVSGEEEADEEVNLDELLESLKEEVEEEGRKEEEEEQEEAKKLDEATKLASSGIGAGKAGGTDNKKPSAASSSSSKIESGGLEQEGVPSVDSTKVGPGDPTTASRPNEGPHATKTNLSTPSMGGKTGGSAGGGKGIKGSGVPSVDSTKEHDPDSTPRPNRGPHATKDNLSTPGGMLEEIETLRRQRDEAYETVSYVKGQLNEINLLNAKLLYTNKLFKEYNMNNEQKMRIVEMFDLSKSVREVKLTYANIAESLNFGGTDVRRKTATAASPANVQTITEGLASKPVGSTKPKEIISEGKFATRMKQLAGIRSAPQKK
jgi:hypothetical protein